MTECVCVCLAFGAYSSRLMATSRVCTPIACDSFEMEAVAGNMVHEYDAKRPGTRQIWAGEPRRHAHLLPPSHQVQTSAMLRQ